MWRRLPYNASTRRFSRIVSVGVDLVNDTRQGSDGFTFLRAEKISARSATIRDNKVTRQSHKIFDTPQKFWSWLIGIGSDKKAITLWCADSQSTLPTIGTWQAIGLEQYKIKWSDCMEGNGGEDVDPSKVKTGIVILTGPPTVIVGKLMSGAMLRILDVGNFAGYDREKHSWYLKSSLNGIEREPDCEEDTDCNCARQSKWVLETAVAINQWIAEHDLGMQRWTIAGQALACYRHRFNSHDIICHDESDVRDLESKGYYGGRIACFYVGPIGPPSQLFEKGNYAETNPMRIVPISPVWKLDCNSLYPSVMRDGMFPRRLLDWRIGTGTYSDLLSLDHRHTIAEVLIDSPVVEFPIRHNGEPLYVRGQFSTVLAGEELYHAKQLGVIKGCRSWATYDCTPIFQNYVEFCWQYRLMALLQSNHAMAYLWKAMLNSLSGKFAQRTIGWVVCPNVVVPAPWTQWVDYDPAVDAVRAYRSIGWVAQVAQLQGYADHAFVAIAAFVTAAARRKMDQYRQLAGAGNYYYQGVDSLHVSDRGLANLEAAGAIDETGLGKLRIVSRHTNSRYQGQHYYTLDGVITCAGRKSSAIQMSDGDWEQIETQSLDCQVHGPEMDSVRRAKVKRTWLGKDTTGRVNQFGWCESLTFQDLFAAKK